MHNRLWNTFFGLLGGELMSLLKDESAFLPVLGYIIATLFTLIIMVGIASSILSPITTPIINATPTHSDISTTAVNRGFTAIDSAGVVIPLFSVIGFLIFLILTNRSTE